MRGCSQSRSRLPRRACFFLFHALFHIRADTLRPVLSPEIPCNIVDEGLLLRVIKQFQKSAVENKMAIANKHTKANGRRDMQSYQMLVAVAVLALSEREPALSWIRV
jgi:hypothetical protein